MNPWIPPSYLPEHESAARSRPGPNAASPALRTKAATVPWTAVQPIGLLAHHRPGSRSACNRDTFLMAFNKETASRIRAMLAYKATFPQFAVPTQFLQSTRALQMAGFPGGETGRTCIAPMRDQPSSSLLIVLAQAGAITPVWSPSCGNETFSASCGPALPFAWMNPAAEPAQMVGPLSISHSIARMPGIGPCGFLKQDTFPDHNLAYIVGTTFRHFSGSSAQPELFPTLVFPLF